MTDKEMIRAAIDMVKEFANMNAPRRCSRPCEESLCRKPQHP
jgi:hypothetical protein